MTTVLRQHWRTARKAHRCDYANCKIAPGERYESQACEGDGTCWTWKSCEWHAAAAAWIFAEWNGDYVDGLDWEAMSETLADEWRYATDNADDGAEHPMPFDWNQR